MLTHFADEMLGEQYTFSKKQYSEEESVFVKKARENLRVHPNVHEMAKLRFEKSTQCKMIVMLLLFCNLKSIDLFSLTLSAVFHKLYCYLNISYTVSDVLYSICPLCLGICLSVRSPGDIKNYLQEKALEAIRLHTTPSLSAQISKLQSDATVTIDRNKDHVMCNL